MKKIGLLLFLACVGVIAFTGNQCRKKVKATPLDTTNTVPVVKDTSGQTLVVTFKDGITASATPKAGAIIYLVNNYDDWKNWDILGGSLTKGSYITAKTDGFGNCTFPKVRPATGISFPGHAQGYEYYMKGFWHNPSDPTDSIVGYAYTGTSSGGEVAVAINGTKQVTVAPH
jgi:hypothetical protein